jgi:hypothetical protein
MPTTELVRHQVPMAEFAIIQTQAETLAQSDIIPSAYRRRPANIIVAALTGRTHGWDVLTAMRNGHVIEGTWGMKPEAMLGLVRAAGHSVTGETKASGATVHGKRADTGDEMTVTFDMEDARAAGLAGKATWKQYPQMMCYWRAVGLLCRMLFSDVTLGVHTTDELGAETDEDGGVIDAQMPPAAREPEPLSAENIEQFVAACSSEGLDPERVLDEAFGDGVRPDPLTTADLPAMRDAFRSLSQRASSEGPGPQSDEPSTATEGAPAPGPSPDEVPGVRGSPATREQVGKIKGEYQRLGVMDRVDQLAYTASIIGVVYGSHNQLTRGQAHEVIEALVAVDHLEPLPDGES